MSDKTSIAREFYSKVLSLNFYDLQHDENKDRPKGKKRVPLTFKSADEYVKTFEPLLFEECRAQMLQKRDEAVTVCKAKPKYSGELNGFFIAGFSVPEANLSQFATTDLILVTRNMPKIDENGVGALTEDDAETHLIGCIEMLEPGCLRVKFYINPKDRRSLVMQNYIHYADMEWWVQKLCTISTLHREYEALHLAKNYPVFPVLLQSPDHEHNPGIPKVIPEHLLAHLEQMYNPTQLQAIQSALSGKGMTLIQGPPGTGKTHVILGLLSVLLHSKLAPPSTNSQIVRDIDEVPETEKTTMIRDLQPWTSPNYVNPRDDFSKIDPNWAQTQALNKMKVTKRVCSIEYKVKTKKQGARILVCAPSNGAVDEIVRRLMTDGLLNEHGTTYRPRFVRVGPGAHKDVQEVCLEHIVQNRIQASETVIDLTTARNEVLESVSIVATTLSFSGASVFSKMSGGFDYVIIDEAAQAVETSTLIPMQYKSKNVIMIGDPKQLPATIISQNAVARGYDQSLFQRLQRAHYPVCMLDIQYRMHPAIRSFPSNRFYDDKLVDCDGILQLKTQFYHNNPCFGPLMVYDMPFSEEIKSAHGSVYNTDEAMMVLSLYKLLLQTYPDIDFTGKVGVISPYKQQVLVLRDLFTRHLEAHHSSHVIIDTVDAFQGREKDIIFVSCVRTPNPDGGIGFLSDVRRMNVLLTRPKSSIIVVGNANALNTDPDWSALVQHARSVNSFARVTAPMEQCVANLADNQYFSDLLAKSAEVVLNKPQPKRAKRLVKASDVTNGNHTNGTNENGITATEVKLDGNGGSADINIEDFIDFNGDNKENRAVDDDFINLPTNGPGSPENGITKKRKQPTSPQPTKMAKV